MRVLLLVSKLNPNVPIFLDRVLAESKSDVVTVAYLPVSNRSLLKWLSRQIAFWGLKASIFQVGKILRNMFHASARQPSLISEFDYVCKKHGVAPQPVDDPNAATFIDTIRQRKIDVLVSFQSWILRPTVLSAPAKAALNIHTGILPGYRGVRPVFRMMDDNLAELGVTIHTMTTDIDAGLMVESVRWPNDPGSSLMQNNRLAYIAAAEALLRALKKVSACEIQDLPVISPDSRYFGHPTAAEARRARKNGMRFS